jgi:hypothetical protein
MDKLLSWVGRWPYECRTCNRRFHHTSRWGPVAPKAGKRRVTPHGPVAHVVVKADTHEQLDHILLALHNAVTESKVVYHPHNRVN